MAVYLVRHAVAQSRSEWGARDDEQRPLTKRGERQAGGLLDLVNGADVRRVLSSPAVRCVDTVAPLAAKLGLDVTVEACLAEGAGGTSATALARVLATSIGDTVLCTHGDIVPEILRHVARDGASMPDELRWAKGSTWVLELDGDRFVEARYVPPSM